MKTSNFKIFSFILNISNSSHQSRHFFFPFKQVGIGVYVPIETLSSSAVLQRESGWVLVQPDNGIWPGETARLYYVLRSLIHVVPRPWPMPTGRGCNGSILPRLLVFTTLSLANVVLRTSYSPTSRPPSQNENFQKIKIEIAILS